MIKSLQREAEIKCKSRQLWVSFYPSQSGKYQQILKGCRKTRTLTDCWRDCKLVQPLRKSIWKIIKKLTINLLYDPAIPLPSTCPKDSTSYSTETCSTMLVTALFTIARKQKQPKCPSADELIIAGYNPIREMGTVLLREGEGGKYGRRWEEVRGIAGHEWPERGNGKGGYLGRGREGNTEGGKWAKWQ